MSKTIIYSSPFVPAEWIAAHGLTPSRIVPRQTESSAPVPGVCPYVRAFVRASSEAEAVIVATTCDQMRRAADLIARESGTRVFAMCVPHTWQTGVAFGLYVEEIERLGRFLVSLGGEAPSADRLRDEAAAFDAMRHRIRAMRESMASRPYSELIAGFGRCGVMPSAHPVQACSTGVPIALVGGPLMANHYGVFDLIEQAGGHVALDATETGERGLPAPLDPRELSGYPLLPIADAYFRGLQDPFRRPNSGFFDWLERAAAERGVQGVILWRYVWCDTWHAEAQRIKERLGLPFLHLDIGDDGADDVRTLSRLQSFMEMLS